MTRRNPPARWVLPLVIDPPKKLCFTIEVPDDPYHIAAFRGALLNLASGYNWQDDPDHLARQVALVWRNIVDEVLPCVDCIDDTGEEWSEELSICDSLRFNDGKLQGFCCGEWVDIPGQGDVVIGGPGQQGGGAEQPTPGGNCVTYHAQFDAKSQYLIPTVVNAGDTLTFSNRKGSGYDGSFLGVWNCPNGQTFFAGGCVGVGGPAMGDPAAAVNHMALIVQIDGTWYPAYEGSITVPGGVSNAQATIQVNDSTLGDNSGSYSLDIAVCNNAVTTWIHDLSFAINPQGFTLVTLTGWLPNTWGVWTAAAGWKGTSSFNSGIGYHSHNVDIARVFSTPFTLTAASMTFNLTKGNIIAGLTNGLYFTLAGSNVIVATHASDTQADGTGLLYTIAAGSYSVDGIEMVIHDSFYTSGADGTSLIYNLHIEGSGPDPFV